MNFELFKKANIIYEHRKPLSGSDHRSSTKTTICRHVHTVLENNILNCLKCGEEIVKNITHDKDWKCYQSKSGRRLTNPTRVHLRKSGERNISNDVQNMGFSETIITVADKLYKQVTNGKIYRGNSRKSIIFACIFHAYKLSGNHQTAENLIKIFGLNRKNGLKGLKIVNVNAPRDSEIHKTFITPIHLIEEIMSKFFATKKQIEQVRELFYKTKNKSSKLNRSRPQSIAASLVFYWIKLTKLSINIKQFSEKVNLSELTILRNTKEIDNILNTHLFR